MEVGNETEGDYWTLEDNIFKKNGHNFFDICFDSDNISKKMLTFRDIPCVPHSYQGPNMLKDCEDL